MESLVARGFKRYPSSPHPAGLRDRRSGAPVSDGSGDITQDAALRAAGASGLLAIGLIHFVDLFSKLRETPYLGVLYLALIGAVSALALALISGKRLRATWLAVAGVAGLTALGYVLSRSTGLPANTVDVGNWQEPLGLASLWVEGLVILMAGWALTADRRATFRRR